MALRFTPGRRRKAWNRNVVALGLAAGFLEPLEAPASTSSNVHAMLLRFFPDRDFATADIDRYKPRARSEFNRVRDFLLLHYTQTERTGAFWEHSRSIPLTTPCRKNSSCSAVTAGSWRGCGVCFP